MTPEQAAMRLRQEGYQRPPRRCPPWIPTEMWPDVRRAMRMDSNSYRIRLNEKTVRGLKRLEVAMGVRGYGRVIARLVARALE
jgi:hypothetical protein